MARLLDYVYSTEDLSYGGLAKPGEVRPAVVVKDLGHGALNVVVFTDGVNDFALGRAGSYGFLCLESRTVTSVPTPGHLFDAAAQTKVQATEPSNPAVDSRLEGLKTR